MTKQVKGRKQIKRKENCDFVGMEIENVNTDGLKFMSYTNKKGYHSHEISTVDGHDVLTAEIEKHPQSGDIELTISVFDSETKERIKRTIVLKDKESVADLL